MCPIVFEGVSPRSLGDLVKGYGIMAVLGEDCPEALFWWDEAFHLVVERPSDQERDEHPVKADIERLLISDLPTWAGWLANEFKPTRQKSCNKPLPCPDHPHARPRGKKRTCPEILQPRKDSRLKHSGEHDEFDPVAARWARAIVLPRPDAEEAEPHPLWPAYGQEGSGDYFFQLEKAAEEAKGALTDISWSLWGHGSALKGVLASGYLFFPETMKRYATGLEWVREKDAARTPWDFLLAVRGAVLLRGSLRRLRWGRRRYPAFPFVFEGSTVDLGGGRFFRNIEVHLPTWGESRARTLAEFEMQVRQFQARLSGKGFAATAAEFRAAVVGRGAGAAFDIFHRFVLEGRRPGQRQPMRQAIPRGATRVGGLAGASSKLRLMLAPIAETGWFDQFTTDRLRAARAGAEEAIHQAVDEPGHETYRGVLEALWDLNRSIILPGALRNELEEKGRTPRPLPLLPVRLWEEALREGLERDPAYRLGRAIGSMLGVRSKANAPAVGPILEHMLPVQYDWGSGRWVAPNPPPSRPARWAGLDPLADFRMLVWSRWLESAELERLPFAAARFASLEDAAALLRGDVSVREVHRLAGLFALLDWQRGKDGTDRRPASRELPPLPPAYVALRLWLELGIEPPPERRPPRDGEVVRLLTIGQSVQVERAVERALTRLRVDGLPWDEEPRPMGKAVARFRPAVPSTEADRMALAVMVPISEQDKLTLSRRLWVPVEEMEVTA